ncbi:efflux RND transporter periplasmic adaptor subunit [uncultured Arenimonas sp.]|uniref:efflux RND transporter periplasmic adaptor subunit n=1 Tax=uncultured Arenimonas sp. TaxID=546226 RepID=UPI0030D806F1
MTAFDLRALLALSCGLLLAACGSDQAASPSTPSLSVSVAEPAMQTLPRRIAASGSIAAWEEVVLGVELSGQRVASVEVEVGDVVEKGQPLLRLDTRTLAMELRQAEANLKVASANARRGERLRREQLVAASEAEQLIAGEITARAQAENARLRMEFATLRAPHDGVISARNVQPGQVITAGAELLRMIRDQRLEWRAELPEAALVQIEEGMPVRLQAPDGQPVEGTVRTISPGLDSRSRTGTVFADLPDPGGLRAGMYAAGEIELAEREVRTVPAAAIVERDGYRYLFVLGEGDVVAQRRVELGARSGDVVEVTEGLQGDERVVVEGAGFLADGDLVRVVAASEG